MTNSLTARLIVVVLVASSTLCAQTAGPWSASSAPPNAPAVRLNVRNVPLSADVITEYDRVLAYGGHIHREIRGKVYRDSAGRVRTETEQPELLKSAGRPEHITIQDPEQHLLIHLDPRSRTATIYRTAPKIVSKDATTVTLPKEMPSPGGSNPASITPASRGSSVARSEDLGTKLILGVPASGTRTTRTFESELLENGAPAVSVTETWFSRDLQIVLLSQTEDNQLGRDTMKVVNVVRAEPDPQLFLVPPGYTVKETTVATASAKR